MELEQSGRKGKPVKSGDRKTVLSVYKYFQKCHPGESVSFLVKKTKEATGKSERSIFRFRKEEEAGELVTPRKKRRKVEYSNSRSVKYNDFVRSAIRRIVHSFFEANTPPTLAGVLAKVNENPDLPNFKRTSLWRVLKESGFCFDKRAKNALLLERNDIIVWRHSYLRKIKNLRKQGKPLFFLDETWVNVGHAASRVWRDTTINNPKQAYLAGLTTGLKEPTKRGPRFVIVHAGSESGFVKGAKFVFLAKKGTVDFHDEMNANTFEEWFFKQLLPNIPAGSAVVVMDNAPYHSRKVEKLPNTKTKKDDIKKWLQEKNINFPNDSLKKELLAEVDKVRHLYNNYFIDEKSKELGFSVIRIPPYHCELNPIELVWSQVKRHVAMHNTEFKERFMMPLIDNALDAVTPEQWSNYCKHIIKVEDKMWEADNLQDDVEPFIVQLNGSSSSEGSSDSGSVSSTFSGVEPLSTDPIPGPSTRM